MPSKRDDFQLDPLARYLKYTSTGLQFFVAFGLPTAAGIWADRKLGTGVLLTLVGLAFGFAAGAYSLWRELFPPDRSGAKRGAGPGTPGPGRDRPGNDAPGKDAHAGPGARGPDPGGRAS